MRKILLTVFILFIGLFLSSCFIGAGSDKTSSWKKTTKIPEVKSTNTPSRTIQSSGRGKVLTNTIEGMTEGVPGVLNAAGVVLAIIDASASKSARFCEKRYSQQRGEKNYEAYIALCIRNNKHLDRTILDDIAAEVTRITRGGRFQDVDIGETNQERILKNKREQEQILLNRAKHANNKSTSKEKEITEKNYEEQQNIILANREQQQKLLQRIKDNKTTRVTRITRKEKRIAEITANQERILKHKREQEQIKLNQARLKEQKQNFKHE